jgi:predicted DsbA family dithiol-disulfide isomerase
MEPIHIYSDVICPWCYVGKARLDDALGQLGLAGQVELVWHPFELDPGTPAEGKDRLKYLARYGSPEKLKEMDARLNGLAADAGIKDFNVGKASKIPNTFQAHRLMGWAGRRGKAHELADALFRANFSAGEDVSDLDVLVKAAESVGLDGAEARTWLKGAELTDELRAEEEQAHEMGIQGVPFYVINGQGLSGAQPLQVFLAALNEAAASK